MANSPYVELSLRIEKASYDAATKEHRWSAIASDIDLDSHAERMSLGLYRDFIERAERKERPPERFCSAYWSGGMPYLSLSHYSDQNGNAVPGVTQKMYIDGKRFRCKGTFLDNSIGKASFDAIQKDKGSDRQDKVRISIGFLDYAHYHGQVLFERKSLRDECPMCAMGIGDITYAKGLLLHLALTRCPVNIRTDIRPDEEGLEVLSMATRKEDAASIVGEEIASELDKSEVVIRSETQESEPALVERADEEEAVEEAPIETPAEAVEEKSESKMDMGTLEKSLMSLHEKMDMMMSKMGAGMMKSEATPAAHVLDTALANFRSAFDGVQGQVGDVDAKLRQLQPAFEALAAEIHESVVEIVPPAQEVNNAGVTRSEFNEALIAINEKLSLISTQLNDRPTQPVAKSVVTPQRMSVSPAQLVQQKSANTEQPVSSFAKIARKSVGLSI